MIARRVATRPQRERRQRSGAPTDGTQPTEVPLPASRFTPHAPRPTPALWALLAITLAGAALRCYDLGTESYWVDEIYTLRRVARSLRGLGALFLSLEQAPAYYLLTRGWVALVGTGEAALRALSVIAGVAAIPLIALVGRDLFGRRVGLIAAALLAISPMALVHSQSARPYSLYLLATLASYWALVRLLRQGRPRDGVLYAAATMFLVYTHYYGLFVLLAQGAAIASRRPWRAAPGAWRRAGVLLALGLAPAALLAGWWTLRGWRFVNEWIPRPQPWWALQTIWGYLFPPGSLAPLALLLGLIGLLCGLGWRRWRPASPRLAVASGTATPRDEAFLLTSCWMLCPIACPLILSWLVRPLYVDRYTLPALPAVLLLLAVALDAADRLIPAAVVVASLALVIAPGLGNYYRQPVNEQWREVAALLGVEGRAGEVVILAPAEQGGLRSALTWYYPGELPTCGIEHTTREPAALTAAFSACAADHTGVWVILRHNPDRNPDRTASFAAFFTQGDPPGFARSGDYPFAVLHIYHYARR